ncbi:MAG: hypothetical protein ACLFQK_09760, partial [Fibrobacterota bacterium]
MNHKFRIIYCVAAGLLSLFAGINAGIIFEEDFEPPDPVSDWNTSLLDDSRVLFSISGKKAFSGKGSLCVPNDSVIENFLGQAVMLDLNTDIMRNGIYIDFFLKAEKQKSPHKNAGYNEIVRFYIAGKGKPFSNPAILIHSNRNNWRPFLLQRSKPGDDPFLIDDPNLGLLYSRWYKLTVFLSIIDDVFHDSLFVDGRFLGYSKRKTEYKPKIFQEIFLGIGGPGQRLHSVYFDNLTIRTNRNKKRLPLEFLRPLKHRYFESEDPVFLPKQIFSDSNSKMYISLLKNGTPVHDSIFKTGLPASFGKLKDTGEYYFLAGPSKKQIHKNRFGPFYIGTSEAGTSTWPAGDGLFFSFGPGGNRFQSGDTFQLHINYNEKIESQYFDINLRHSGFSGNKKGRYGEFDSTTNLVFSINERSKIHYKFRENKGLNKWLPVNTDSSKAKSFPYNLIDFQAIDRKSEGRVSLPITVTEYMKPGLWIISGYSQSSTTHAVEKFPPIYFFKEPPSRFSFIHYSLLLIVISGSVGLFYFLRKKNQPSGQPEAWKKIAADVENLLNEKYADPDLDREKIAEKINLSVRRLNTIYTSIEKKSMVKHLREIR